MRTPALRTSSLVVILLFAASSPPATEQLALPTDFVDELVVGNLAEPTNIAFLPDGRLLVVERVTARVRMVDGMAMGSPDPIALVDSVQTADGEQGLLGIAVDPDWPIRPFVYVQHSLLGQVNRITRYTATGDLDGTGDRSLTLDPASRRLVLQFPDDFPRHNGGSAHFGPDGMLYSSLGDDGGICDPLQLTRLKGKILRLDVSRIPAGPGPRPPVAMIAPPDNPFAAHPDSNAQLVYAYGLRNPFSFRFDSMTGHLFIADVGGNLHEELDWANAPGMSFGWPHKEGPVWRGVSCAGVDTTNFVDPIASYPHGSGAAIITAGAYRPPAGATKPFPADYWGDAFYNDFYQPFVRRLRFDGSGWSPAPPAPGQPNATDWASNAPLIATWAVGPDGSLYYARMWVTYPNPDGQIRRIVHTGFVDVRPPVTSAMTLAARPVPSAGPVRLSFALERSASVELVIHDLAGRLVRELLPRASRPAGTSELAWDGRDTAGSRVRPGVYLVRLAVDGAWVTLRIALLD